MNSRSSSGRVLQWAAAREAIRVLSSCLRSPGFEVTPNGTARPEPVGIRIVSKGEG